MAENIVSADEFFAGGQAVQDTADKPGAKIVSAEEFFGGEKPATPTVNAIPDEHRVAFINKLGADMYQEMLDSNQKFLEDTRTRITGGVSGGLGGVNEFIGNILKRTFAGQVMTAVAPGVGDKLHEVFVEPGREALQQSVEATPPKDAFQELYFSTLTSLGSMAPHIALDIMLGGATKMALVGRVLPKMEALLGGVHDFAIGMGWEGMVRGIEESSNPIEGAYKGIVGGLEGTSWGMLYANAGAGLSGIGKMATLGFASTVYEAAKEGRAPTKEEMVDGFTHGAAIGIFFTALPHLIEGTKVSSEKAALREYQGKIDKALGKSDTKSGKDVPGQKDPSELLTHVDDLLHDENIRPQIREALAQPFLDVIRSRGEIVPPELSLAQWKNPANLSLALTNFDRNIERIAPSKDIKSVKEFVSDYIRANENEASTWWNKEITELNTITRKYGLLNKKNRELVQRYGEGNATLASIQVDAPKDWQNIRDAAKWYRDKYDLVLDTVNPIREYFDYPPIQKRADYFRHFHEMDLAGNLYGFLFGGRNVPTSIAGVINKTRAGKPFTPVEMKRMGGKYTEDAVKGYRDYLTVVKNQIFHTESVQRLRALENYIRMQAEAGDNIDLSNVMVNLRDYTDIVGGNLINFDKAVADFAGPWLWDKYRFIQKRTASNMVGYNFKTALYNFIPLMTQAPVEIGKTYWLKGVFNAAMSPFSKNPMEVDGVVPDFMLRRYLKRPIPLNFWESGTKMASDIMLAVDFFSVKAMYSGKYFELKDSGVPKVEAQKQASEFTGRLVTDRSHGQLPIAMESKALKVFTLFQTEVQNQFSWAIQDIPQKYKGQALKTLGKLTEYAVYCWVFNNISEDITGTRPLFDPLYALMAMFKINKSGRGHELGDRVETAFGELVAQMPFGNINPLSGRESGRYPVTAAFPDVKNLRSHPFKETSKSLLYLAMPFGGGQAKKTLEGIQDYWKGARLTPSGNEKYGIAKDARNFAAGTIFGRNAFPEAVRFWSLPKDDR